MKNALELIEDYSKEFDIDTQIDSTNIMEKQMSAPNVKHKWLYRMIKSKKRLLDLMENKENFIQKSMVENNPLHMNKAKVATSMASNITYKELQRSIKDQELLVEYLDSSVNKIFSQIGFDFKNLVELMKMEQL
jgi:hypothetical protein